MEEQAVKERAEALVELTHHIAFRLRAAAKPHTDGELSYDAAVTAAATLVAVAHRHDHA